MGIPVTCRNGHHFSVKDKYAGKKGLCPYCEGQVEVRVPDALSSHDFNKACAQAIREKQTGRVPTTSDSSVFDSMPDESSGSSSGSSLLGSSVVRHNIRCKCGESVPMWFAKCPKCGVFLEHY
jgi:hypothetical protein